MAQPQNGTLSIRCSCRTCSQILAVDDVDVMRSAPEMSLQVPHFFENPTLFSEGSVASLVLGSQELSLDLFLSFVGCSGGC